MEICAGESLESNQDSRVPVHGDEDRACEQVTLRPARRQVVPGQDGGDEDHHGEDEGQVGPQVHVLVQLQL